MFESYLKVILRILAKQRIYTAINVISLALGLAFFVLVMGYLLHEFSYETVHENRNRILRVNGSVSDTASVQRWAQVNKPIGDYAAEHFPEVETAAIFRYEYETPIEVNEIRFVGGPSIYATPEFFDVFTFPLSYGDPQALAEPYRVFIKEEAIERYFPHDDPIGEWVMMNDSLYCRIAGIVETAPTNTQYKFDFLISYSTLEAAGDQPSTWSDFGHDFVFLLVREDTDVAGLEAKLVDVLRSNLHEEDRERYEIWTTPLLDIYFSAYYNDTNGDIFPAGEWDMIIIMGAFAIFILVQAVFNYINLATARTSHRIKEVGVRRIHGARRNQLVLQFLGESFVLVLVALILSIGSYELFRPLLHSAFENRALTANLVTNSYMPLALISVWILVSLGAGLYPSVYLSRFKPLSLLQQSGRMKTSKSWFRRILVVLQFTIALFFIICTVIIYRQMDYISSLERGFRIENMLVLEFDGDNAGTNCQVLKNELQRVDASLVMSVGSAPPGVNDATFYRVFKDQDLNEESIEYFRGYLIDENFHETFELDIVQGQALTEIDPAARDHAILVTQTVITSLGIENPIGHKLYRSDGRYFEIVGVVEDFMVSLHGWSNGTENLLRMVAPEHYDYITIQLPENRIRETIAMVNETWVELFPSIPFEYSFLDDRVNESMHLDMATGHLLAILALITIIIACLGVFGLVTYAAEQRTKEIGIRKVLGASVNRLISLLAKEFIILIAISAVIASPLALLMMGPFLHEFTFQITIGPWTFILPALFAVFMASVTAGWQAFKAARKDPVNSLRHE